MTYRDALKSVVRASNPSISHNTANANAAAQNTDITAGNRPAPNQASLQLPGTIFRIHIPAGTAANFQNLIEVATPSGITFNVRLPLLGDLIADGFRNPTLLKMMDAVRAAGGTIELLS